MKFTGTGIVWDKAKNKRLVRFDKGEAEVQDKATQEALQALGYEGEGEPAEDPENKEPENDNPTDYASMGVTKLREIAKEQKIKNYTNMNHEELLEALGGDNDDE